ncbi:MAG: GNAT family N-acetyltransferase [Nitriliruptoraceae bacterium]|nr:GNAT family N-acetyltransferase [Nitriliruptoraceae bacterium]
MSTVRELLPGETDLAHTALSVLRPAHAGDRARFVAQVDGRQRHEGYRLFASFESARSGSPKFGPGTGDAVAVAGFRPLTNLAWGTVLYIDDLSTHPGHRGRGHASALLDAVEAEAGRLGCDAVHLDSGHQRHDAHRLYLAAGYTISSHHFVKPLAERR